MIGFADIGTAYISVRRVSLGGVCNFAALALIFLLAPCDRGMAHEFWLEMESYRPPVGARVSVTYRIGQNFDGDSYPYLGDDTERFSLVTSQGEANIQAVDGDDPAAQIQFRRGGLATVVYRDTIGNQFFETFEKFEAYLKAEGLERFGGIHRARSKPMTKIHERYFRCAKALVAVGDGGGEDRAVGLPLELVLEHNPYKMRKEANLPVRLLYKGKPLSGATIKLFSQYRPSEPIIKRSDAAGRVSFQLPASSRYMLHSVHMREPSQSEHGDWYSLWASLTFELP